MAKVGLVIDNSAAMTTEDCKRAGVDAVVPISFIVNGKEYYEGVNMTDEDFYNFLGNKDCNVSTSQPSIELVKDAWRKVLIDHDELVYVLLSSGLSGACNSAINASHEPEFEGKVFVANNQRVSYMNKMAMYEAGEMIREGKSACVVKDYLEHTKGECGAYIAVDTLKYLKKGGRITPAVAAIGTILNIKPILQVHGGKLDSYSKSMSMKQAKQKIIQAARKEAEERFADQIARGEVLINIAHTYKEITPELLEFRKEVEAAFPDMKFGVMDPLPLFIACHTGPNALAVGFALDRLGVYGQVKN